ncbi:MAG: hypothetical protein AB7T49_19335 [Oligoflexales bacterium]
MHYFPSQIEIWTAVHLVGFAVAFAAVSFGDFIILRGVFRKGVLHPPRLRRVGELSRCVVGGLGLMTVSGGFLAWYKFAANESLQKFFAKMTIVAVIVGIGIILHRHLLPSLNKCAGKPLALVLKPKTVAIFAATGSASGISWWSAFLLGALPSLGRFTYVEIISVYITISVIGTATTAICAYLWACKAQRAMNRHRAPDIFPYSLWRSHKFP